MIEQSELTWYLSEGISVFERSTTGAILEKLDRDAHVSRDCPVCDGQGIMGEKTIRRGAPRIRWVRDAKSGDWCERCHGTGVLPMRLSHDEQALVDSGDWAMPSDHAGQRSAVPDAVLVRYAYVSRILHNMPSLLRDALVMGYSDAGEELSATLHGRSWACSPLTKAGGALLSQERERRTRVEGVEPERPIQCMTALANLNGQSKNKERKELLAEASRQAVQLLRMAEARWDAVASGQVMGRS
jgi:hypothetical protein